MRQHPDGNERAWAEGERDRVHLGLPLVIGAGFLLLGAVLMIVWRAGNPRGYFERRAFEAVDPRVASGHVAVPETAGAPAGD